MVAVGFGASSLGFLELSGLAGLEHLPSDPRAWAALGPGSVNF